MKPVMPSQTRTSSFTNFAQDGIQAAKSVTSARLADRGQIDLGIAAQQFDNIRPGLASAGVQLEGNKLRERDDAELATGVDPNILAREGIPNRGRKTIPETDDLHQAKRTGDVDDSAERIVTIWFPQFSRETFLAQGCHEHSHARQVRVHSQIDILGEANVAVSGQCHCPDDHGWNALSF